MYARVVRGRLRPAEIDDLIDNFRSEGLKELPRIPGVVEAQLWADRESGEFVGIGMYETEEGRTAAARVAADAQPLIGAHSDQPPPGVGQLYDLVFSVGMDARAVVERAVDAINRGDLEQLARDLAPDALLRYARPGGAEVRGPQAVKEHYQGWLSSFPDLQVTASRIVALGGTVILVGSFSGTHTGTLTVGTGDISATGRKVGTEFVQVFTVELGMIREIVTYSEFASVMMQLGLTPTQIQMST